MAKAKQRPQYTPNMMPLVLMQNACMIRNDGAPCSLYEHKVEIKEGEKADVHYCHGNMAFCDYAMGIALELSDSRSGLSKKAFAGSKE